jgi:hypothetical protein
MHSLEADVPLFVLKIILILRAAKLDAMSKS